MNRTEKHGQVEAFRENLGSARHAFLVDFQGLKVSQDTEFRSRLRKAEARYKVVKNRLARRSLQGTFLAPLDGQFRGCTGLALSAGDPVALAKVLVEFAKDNPALKIKGAILEGGAPLEPAQVEALSALPALPQLRAQLLAMVLAPAGKLVRLLAEPGRQVVRAVEERRRSQEGAE